MIRRRDINLAISIICLFTFGVLLQKSYAEESIDGRLSHNRVRVIIHCGLPPTYYYDKKEDRYSGFFVDVMDNIAKRAGLEVSYSCESSWTEIIKKISSGKADIGAMTITEGRKPSLTFTTPFETSNVPFFIRSQSGLSINNVSREYVVGMADGSAVYEYIKSRKNMRFVFYDNYQQAIFSLLAGEIDLLAAPEPTVLKLLRDAGLEERVGKTGESIYEAKRGIAVRKNEKQLLDKLNVALAGFIGSPEYQKIYIKWYGKPAPYWTQTRIISIGAVLLLISVSVMAFWRYKSIMALNEELRNNITERRKTEDALRESNNMLDTILQASPAAISVMDADGIILMWNRAAEKIFGWSCEEAIGRLNPIVPKDKLEEFAGFRNMILNAEEFLFIEVQRQRKDSNLIETSISAAPLYDAHGVAKGIISVMLDITHRKKIEQELYKAKKFDSLAVASGGIAHDFNNFITAIIGSVGLIKLTADPSSKAVRWLDEIEMASLRARSLTNQLMTFSKGGPTVMKPASIGDIIRDSASFALRSTNSKLDIDISDGLWLVDADDGQISQVIHNIVINADQSMPEGGIVRIKCDNTVIRQERANSPQIGRYVKISIEDHGNGIPRDSIEKIFDPYFTTKQKGNGLGLAMSYSIVQKHKGYISVESEQGRGTIFHIHLPISKSLRYPYDSGAV